MIKLKQGYIAAATNSIIHLQMAVDLRLSLRNVDPQRPFALIVDEILAESLRDFPDVFDYVLKVPPSPEFGDAVKLLSGEVSPFRQTLLIDADCLVLASLDPLWQSFGDRDFCVPGQYVGRDDPRHHHNFEIASLCQLFGLARYYWAISPVFYFNDEGRDVLKQGLSVYKNELIPNQICRWDTKLPPDEIAFAVVGGRRPLREFPPLQTLIKQHDLRTWHAGEIPHEIFHCTMCPRPSVLRWLMDGVATRRQAAGLPQGSRRYWLKKAVHKGIQLKITKGLGLPWRLRKPAGNAVA